MAEGSRVCPFCRRLNSAGDAQCYNCGRRLPGAAETGLLNFGRDLAASDAPITRLMLGLCVLVFGLCAVVEHRIPPLVQGQFWGSTLLRFGAIGMSLGHEEPWRYLAAVFVHANTLHIVMNGFTLASLGGPVEREFGPARFTLLYLLSGALGFVTSDVWYAGHGPLTVGASGAIFGVLGGIIGARLSRKDPTWKDMLVRGAVYVLIFSFLSSVNTAAHAGGLLSGLLLGFALDRLGRRASLALGVAAALGVLATVAALWLSNRSDLWRELRAAEMQQEMWRN